jgi:hypothetical protein
MPPPLYAAHHHHLSPLFFYVHDGISSNTFVNVPGGCIVYDGCCCRLGDDAETKYCCDRTVEYVVAVLVLFRPHSLKNITEASISFFVGSKLVDPSSSISDGVVVATQFKVDVNESSVVSMMYAPNVLLLRRGGEATGEDALSQFRTSNGGERLLLTPCCLEVEVVVVAVVSWSGGRIGRG